MPILTKQNNLNLVDIHAVLFGLAMVYLVKLVAWFDHWLAGALQSCAYSLASSAIKSY